MTAQLKERMVRHIRMNGPLPLAEYMHWCMADKTHGYYQTQTIFGREGDFITAPEVSQMFGELIGVWLLAAWQKLGQPAKINLVELGPGRGTLMADILRATAIDEAFTAATSVHLIETSEHLIAPQKQILANQTNQISWHTSMNELPSAPILLIANEFLDVLPFRQYVKSDGKWHERAISLAEDETLAWTLINNTLEETALPAGHETEPDGAIYEISTTRETFVENIASLISENDGAALFIDYGHRKRGFGDTFQAMASHQYSDPLKEPGKADLTSHVDFTPFDAIAKSTGCHPQPIISQGEFLLELGLLERAGSLGQNGDAALQSRLTREAERLALPHEMGDLFKVFALSTENHLWPFAKST